MAAQKNEPERHDEPQQTPEEYIQSVTLGGHKPLNSSVVLSPYDPDWPTRYATLASQVRSALGSQVLLLEHVGSTSVEGLSAKPVIDMLLLVEDSADEAAYVPALEAGGFRLHIREPGWNEHRLLKGTDIKANLHVFSEGCKEAARMLAFRDWLRAHPADRALYERTKRELAARTWKYTQHYADAKSAVVEQILRRAMEPPRG